MKSALCKNPVAAAVIINFLTMILFIYIISQQISVLYMTIMFSGIINGSLAKKAANINRKNKMMVYLSFFITLGVISLYFAYKFHVRCNQIINGV